MAASTYCAALSVLQADPLPSLARYKKSVQFATMSAAPAHTYRGGNHQNQRLYDRLVERRTELILRSSNSTTDDYEPLILARGIKGLNKWLKTAEVVMEVQPQELEPTPRDGIMYRVSVIQVFYHIRILTIARMKGLKLLSRPTRPSKGLS